MNNYLINTLIVIGCSILIYILFRKINFRFKEGFSMSDLQSSMPSLSTTSIQMNGVGVNADSFNTAIKMETTRMNDILSIKTYNSNYENIILNLDDYFNSLMLQTVLTFDMQNPNIGLNNLSLLHQSKLALNSAMKYVDSIK